MFEGAGSMFEGTKSVFERAGNMSEGARSILEERGASFRVLHACLRQLEPS